MASHNLAIKKKCKIFSVISWGFFIANLMTDLAFSEERQLGYIGAFEKWRKIEIQMIGPESKGLGNPNPFSLFVDVVFIGPGGQIYKVPGFYDGDGHGDIDGNVWKARFSADETGVWRFISSSTDKNLDGYKGSFTITNNKTGNPGFYKFGRLEYIGTATNRIRYLKFRDGPYWLKAGCDDPENFLGNFKYYNSLEKRKHTIDYLSSRGVNCLYIITHNIDGDNSDVWPWLGDTAEKAKSNAKKDVRFHIARLEEWRKLFEYMQTMGVVPYIVLEDDNAWTGYNHERYYREIIARFGDLPALIFNIGEEHNENYCLREALLFAQLLRDMDPYNHPRGIHNINFPEKKYILSTQVNFTSIQTKSDDPLLHNQLAIKWIHLCNCLKKRILMIGFDEPRPLMDRKGWWSAYMGGAVWEIHVEKPYDRPMSTWETVWNQIGGARSFIESMPFWEMEPRNDIVASENAFCLVSEGKAYALYLPFGGEVSVNLMKGVTYDYAWWNPSNNKEGGFENEGRISGGLQVLTSPGSGDWALRIIKVE